jgi:cation diffusion facilitator family transporter
MTTEQYDYLSLENDKDKNEPLISENSIMKNDSSHLFEEDNYLSKIKTFKTETVQEEVKDDKDKPHQSSSSDEDSSHGENNEDLYKKQQDEAIKKLTWVCVICTIFMIIEIIGGYLANSIAIMSDAAHLLSDLLGFVISIISIYISRKVAKNHMSYGYHRAEIIGALVSIVLIWALTIWLLYEATLRIINTPQVDGLIMIIISVIGFSFNVIMGVVLAKSGVPHSHGLHSHGHDHDHDHDHHNEHEHQYDSSDEEIALHDEDDHEHKNTNVNLRASFIHVLGDALQNVGVLIAGVIIFLFPRFSIADPICTYIFSIIVGLTTIRILKDCIFVLMEGSPVDIDIEELEKDLKEIKGVKEIHDLHVWSLSMGKISLSCHICCDDPQKTLKKAKKMIAKKYKIDHITIQVEDNNQNKISCKNDLHHIK